MDIQYSGTGEKANVCPSFQMFGLPSKSMIVKQFDDSYQKRIQS